MSAILSIDFIKASLYVAENHARILFWRGYILGLYHSGKIDNDDFIQLSDIADCRDSLMNDK